MDGFRATVTRRVCDTQHQREIITYCSIESNQPPYPALPQVLASSVVPLWELVNNLSRLEPSRRERYRCTIFGSARAKPCGLPWET
jgi:hypothetical protein